MESLTDPMPKLSLVGTLTGGTLTTVVTMPGSS